MQQNFRPFFVIGAPKSGTTWLQLLLDAHPQIMCKGEAAFALFFKAMNRAAANYNAFIESPKTSHVVSKVGPIGRAELAALYRAFILGRLSREVQQSGRPVQFLGVKDPNLLSTLPTLMAAFPRAAYIQIIRDGRDVWVSLERHHAREAVERSDAAFSQWDRDLAVSGRRWANYIKQVRNVTARARVPYHELRYEALLSDPAATFANLLAFLGAADDPATVAQCLARADFTQLSGGRRPGEEDAGSFFRKGIAGDWRNHLTEEQSRAFCAAAGGLMEELGYAPGTKSGNLH